MTDVAIVTGGAGGIGQAINRRLVEVGYTVVAGDLADMLAKDDPSGERILRLRWTCGTRRRSTPP